MFDPDLITANLDRIAKTLGRRPKRSPITKSIERQEDLKVLWNPDKKETTRELTEEEQQFIRDEIVLSKYDFDYWARRYGFVMSDRGGKLDRITWWGSQKIALRHFAIGEKRAHERECDNLWDFLKARQLGASQLISFILLHRMIFFKHQRIVLASDEGDKSAKLYRRFTIAFDQLPWYMRPKTSIRVEKPKEPCEALYCSKLNSRLDVGHGRKKGGGIGQGDSYNAFHFTELPTWENWEQLEEDFLPTVPLWHTSFGVRESTAASKNDHWAQWFDNSWKGNSRFQALFIPYYSEPHKYSINPPSEWKPSKVAVQHAEAVAKSSPEYCFGKTVKLKKAQLHWWDKTREEYRRNGRLHIFLQEYASNHREAFQNAVTGMFAGDLLIQLQAEARDYHAYDIVIN